MKIKRHLFLFISLISFTSFGQNLDCSELAKKILADSTKTIWQYSNQIDSATLYCLGRYFAQRDIDNNIFQIQNFGDGDFYNPCRKCRYNSYGFNIIYNSPFYDKSDLVFADGYNEVSLNYLKAKIGDSAFAQIEKKPTEYFNPDNILDEYFEIENKQKMFNVSIINDTTVNLKFNVDQLFKDYPQYVPKIIYHVSDFDYNNRIMGKLQTMDSKQLMETGVILKVYPDHKCYMRIVFDFKNIATVEEYCWCYLLKENAFIYLFPVTILE